MSKQQSPLIRHDNVLWLVIAQGAAMLPLLFRLPLWFSGLWFFALIWRWRIHLGKLAFPSPLIKFIISCLCLAGLFFTYRYALGVEAMVGFLVFAFVLKLLELRTRKDAFVLLFIGFIAVASELLFSQTVFTALYAGIACLLLIAAWQTVCLTRERSISFKLKRSSILVLQAMPLMIVMFIVMPRLPPLWKGNFFKGSGQTGFSETMSPGDLSSLVQSQGTAFRVEFADQNVPPLSDLYWRGLVLDSFDGRTWRLNKNWDRVQTKAFTMADNATNTQYTITIEAHHYHWLFSLSQAVQVDTGRFFSDLTKDGLIATQRPLTNRLQYKVMSVAPNDIAWPELTANEYKRLTALPEDYNPQTIALAESWLQENSQHKAIINKALAWYQSSFYYTLRPPALGKDSVDQFLFDSKRGFCEHFASSFTVLMRAAGIPARVVVGYQGATVNPQQDYWIVRQANAHAWTEVWLSGRGWVRIDPTAAVAPQRVEQGIENAFSGEEREALASGLLSSPDWITQLRYQMDALNYQWNSWVLSYNQEKQRSLFQRIFGNSKRWWIGLVFICLFLASLAVIAVLVMREKTAKRNALQKALISFDKRCLRWKIQRESQESIAGFCRRLAKQQPDLRSSCEQLAHLSEYVLYAGPEDKVKQHNQEDLIRALNMFPKQ